MRKVVSPGAGRAQALPGHLTVSLARAVAQVTGDHANRKWLLVTDDLDAQHLPHRGRGNTRSHDGAVLEATASRPITTHLPNFARIHNRLGVRGSLDRFTGQFLWATRHVRAPRESSSERTARARFW